MSLLLTAKRLLSGAVFAVEVGSDGVLVDAPRPLPSDFMAVIHEKMEQGVLHAGVIYGVSQSGGLTLRFSRNFPTHVRQPLLNTWHIHKQRYG